MSTNVIGQIVDSGTVKQEKRSFSHFNSIEIKNIPGDIDIHFGKKNSVSITADSSIISNIITLHENNSLRVYIKESIVTNAPVKIGIEASEILSIDVDGSSNISIHGINAKSLNLNSKGATSFSGHGSVDMLNVNILGNGKLDFSKINSQDCTVTIHGNGSASVYARRNLDVNIKGVGNIIYYGEPVKVTKNIIGVGRVYSCCK
jgi:hypothetical protein